MTADRRKHAKSESRRDWSTLSVVLLALLLQPPAWAESMVGDVAQAAVNAVVVDDPRPFSRRSQLQGSYAAGFDYRADPLLARTARNIARDHGAQLLEQWPIAALDAHCFVLSVPSKMSQAQLLRALSRDPRVRFAQPLNQFKLRASQDPYAQLQTGPTRWDGMSGLGAGEGTTIAVIDSGVDHKHPDLQGAQLEVIDHVADRPAGAEGHGTGIVGLILAQPDNGIGIVGIAPAARLLLLRACWEEGGAGAAVCDTVSLAKALDAAHAQGADVVNLSLTGPADPLLDALVDALTTRGSWVVAAHDVDRDRRPGFPSPKAGVIYAFGDGGGAVGGEQAADATVLPARTAVAQLSALTLTVGGGYGVVSGHSVAAAQISAVVAVLCSAERIPPGSGDLAFVRRLVALQGDSAI